MTRALWPGRLQLTRWWASRLTEWRPEILDANIKKALEKDLVIDITTLGRKSGASHRIEIWFQNLDGELYITGAPGTRGWYANILANPEFTFHLKGTAQADLPATATPIVDDAERYRIMERICTKQGTMKELDVRLARSPLIKVDLREA